MYTSLKILSLPQTIVTDCLAHEFYNNTYDYILLSYTWEDDAKKLSIFNDREFLNKCTAELDRFLLNSSNIKQKISPYISPEQAMVQRWMNKNSLGCAKLYRAGAYYEAVTLMKYNREFSYTSNLYLCGESFSVDAGWTEPCFRGAIDTVIHICNKTQALFNGGFSMQDYPAYKT
ncbi:hypothetical protein AWV77_22775 [Pseudomonas palleroniana]|uniref:Amine oxidase domain-containing protein n=1 Tax=Pseudomonas palleroniana TaxID=191390 RepID=A0A0X7JYV1_9PSED|nr:hypothetical protein AWV77_22775 [Pseudomonas palleroniana]